MRPACPSSQSFCIVWTNVNLTKVSSSSSSPQNLWNFKHLLTICCACRSLSQPPPLPVSHDKKFLAMLLVLSKLKSQPSSFCAQSTDKWLYYCLLGHEAIRFERCLASRRNNSTVRVFAITCFLQSLCVVNPSCLQICIGQWNWRSSQSFSSTASPNEGFNEQGRVVRKPVNVNPGFNVNWSITFSYLEMSLTSNVWCSLRLPQLKTEGKRI